MIAQCKTKADEISTIRRFVSSLPRDSYVRSALEPFQEEFSRGVYSDIVPSVYESWQARIEADREASEARRQADEIRREVEKLRVYLAGQIHRLEKVNDAIREAASSVDVASRSTGAICEKARTYL